MSANHRSGVIGRLLPPVLALAVILAAGVVHGLWSGRWGPSPDIEAASARLQSVPLIVGQWTGTDLPTDSRQLKAAEAAGHLFRQYVWNKGPNESDSLGQPDTVNVLILCGPTGPMAVHPPTVCFTSVGLNQITPTARTRVADRDSPQPHELFETTFAKNTPEESVRLTTLWTWTATGHWQAPDAPRLTFARHPYLYKLYVTREISASLNEPAESEPDPEAAAGDTIEAKFLKALLPELNKALFGEELRVER
ncbi:MAG TPA: exosortase-associated EpsI family protein [Planctomycetaceae bacterium]|nr:exosortase-associated EpsI family protein [Planctomycetaceae bacterium]